MKLIIEDDEGRKTVVPFARDEISIGRQEGNTIRLTERNVSRRHARLLRQNDSIIIEDLGSYNGVLINGERIDARSPIREGDLIEIGDYDLAVEGAPVRNMDDTQPSAAMPTFPRDTDPGQAFVAAVTGNTPAVTGASRRVLGDHESPRLVGIADAFTGVDLRIPKAITVIGRTSDGTDLAIDHPSIGRRHAKLQLEGGVWKIFDLNSANGIEINGVRQNAASLLPGDVIDIGEAKFRFTAPDEIFRPEHDIHPDADSALRPPKPTNLPLIAGIVVALAVLAVIGVLVVQHLGKPQKENEVAAEGNAEDFCTKGQSAAALRNWTEAIKNLSVAKKVGQSCTFPLDAAIASAEQNAKAKQQLDTADKLIAAGQFHQALEALAIVGPDSVYNSEAKLKTAEATEAGVKHLAELARNAIEHNKPDDAAGLIEDLKQLDPSAVMLPQLERELNEKHHTTGAGESKGSVASATQPPSAATPSEGQALPVFTVTRKQDGPPKKSIDERNAIAEAAIAEGIQKIQAGDLSGGVAKLQAAIAETPATNLVARAHRNIGVAYAHVKRMDDAIPHLKIYLKLQPDSPEHDKVQKIITDYEASKGN